MIGQYKRDLSIVPYQDGWQERFEHEAGQLRRVLGQEALRVEHIGSTSIPGMAAKPIIDIMVAVVTIEHPSRLVRSMEGLGYQYKPFDTVPERLFFAKESAPEIRTYHLNLTEPTSGFWKNQLAFRDYLRAHKQLAAEYIELKKHIAEEHARTKVLNREAKTEFVKKVLSLAESAR